LSAWFAQARQVVAALEYAGVASASAAARVAARAERRMHPARGPSMQPLPALADITGERADRDIAAAIARAAKQRPVPPAA